MSKNNTQSTSFFSRHKFKIGGLLLGLVLGIFIPQAFALDGAMWLVSSFFGGSGGVLAGGKIDSNYNARALKVEFSNESKNISVPAYEVYAKAGVLGLSDNKQDQAQHFEAQFKDAAEKVRSRKIGANSSAPQDTYPHPEQPYSPSRRR